jgi:hypothetical protein
LDALQSQPAECIRRHYLQRYVLSRVPASFQDMAAVVSRFPLAVTP